MRDRTTAGCGWEHEREIDGLCVRLPANGRPVGRVPPHVFRSLGTSVRVVTQHDDGAGVDAAGMAEASAGAAAPAS